MRDPRESRLRPGGAAVVLAVVLGLLGTTLLVPLPAQAASAKDRAAHQGSRSLRGSPRAAVNAAYWSRYATAATTPAVWQGGSLARCRPGRQSKASRKATRQAVNFVRSLAGLAPVRFTAALNRKAQRTALMMDANRALDHRPGRSWRCWTRIGATAAARANLALTHPSLHSGGIVGLYMSDPGPTNTAVGHRRWLLHPFTTAMGSGSTTHAHALVVVGPRNQRRANPRWVAWPAAGHFPSTLEPHGRWSLSAGDRRTDFKRARVVVKQNGSRLSVNKHRVVDGFGMPTIVWQMPTTLDPNGTYRVAVKNVRMGKKRLKHNYTVSLFTPSR